MTELVVDDMHESQEGAALEVVRARLHRDFDGAVGPEAVDRAWDAARRRFDGSRIRTFVPILVERVAAEVIRTSAPAEG
ncbi:three-helix bundle dimerization domain-containing protein [Streptacidiphilus rugosus]|uniref:three-helix bundle dimerization domain-containing protein n=1 Tax=Streptacidiphilus rugosus TaxID=405783 RepID=UPI00055C9692|nr:hypothetical protein [Streptacidiphilus rugosus]